MEEKIRSLLCQCRNINRQGRTKNAIFTNYDVIYRTLTDNGIVDFVAHTWTMLELGRLHGGEKVERLLGRPV